MNVNNFRIGKGITVIPETDTVFVVKENHPRLLLELTGDLTTIRGALVLSAAMGVAQVGVADRDLDVSGIVYDTSRNALWITSDTGRAVYLFDTENKTATGFPLTWSNDGQTKPLKNAEGIAVSPNGQRLFVVTDDGPSSRFVAYAVR